MAAEAGVSEGAKVGPGIGRQLIYMALSTLLTLAVAEGAVRVATGGALPQLDCYRREGDRLALKACVRALPKPSGGAWEARVGADGLREVPGRPAGAPWLIAGDSQVFGMGVGDGETTAAAMGRLGVAAVPVGVPGHGLEEALAQAEAEIERRAGEGPEQAAAGVLAVVNAANDWAEIGVPVLERYAVIGDWLITKGRAGTVWGRFFGTPLARSHFGVYAVSLIGRDWSEDPQARRLADSPWGMGEERRRAAARRIALALHSFAARNPEVPLWAVWLPVDFATSEARARAVLREELLAGRPWEVSAPWEELGAAVPGLRVIDLRGALTAPAHFQVGDYHLSAEGHTIAAGVIVQHLQGAQ